MDFGLTTDDLAFRAEVRDWIATAYPHALREKQVQGEPLGKDDMLSWHRILAARGWVAPAWPVEHGGPGWTAIRRHIFAEELALADTTPIMPFGIGLVGPVIQAFGTAEQKARFLPPTLSGDIWWCQGYSEPGAGSDLASLTTRAVRDGDHYVVTGQKIWTTWAHYADWGFFLVRTDPDAKPQAGISFLLIDMTSPGIRVRPIIGLDGNHKFNEVWLDGVRVPVDQRVHDENAGWTCAKFLLANERTGIAGTGVARRGVDRLKALARTRDDVFARKVAELEIDLDALIFTELRAVTGGDRRPHVPSLLKVKGSDVHQRIAELTLEAEGARGALDAGPARTYADARKTSIYGGTNEIQRNIMARLLRG